jgi:hypothetical protein
LVGTPWRQRADKGADDRVDERIDRLDSRKPEDLSYSDAQRIKEIYLGKLRKLEFQKKSGELVDLRLIENAIFEIARTMRDSLQTWPSRVAAIIAAEFGLNPVDVELSLNQHIRQFLTEWTEPGEAAEVLRTKALRNVDGANYATTDSP